MGPPSLHVNKQANDLEETALWRGFFFALKSRFKVCCQLAMDDTPKAVSLSSPPLSPGRKRLYATICLLLPVLAVAALEGGLRRAGLGGHAPVFKEVAETPEGILYVTDINRARSYFFANRERPGYNAQHAFFLPKPAGTVRVLMVGGSAVKGYPQPRHLASSSFLQAMLSDVWPDREVEVLNLGTTAAASFPVMDMTIEALSSDPDLVIVYAGHNEFFGTYGVASRSRLAVLPTMIRFHRRLMGTALVQSLDRDFRQDREQEGKTLMEIMARQSYTAPDHWSRNAAARNVHHHVAQLIEACSELGIPVLVCTLPSNERDLAPLGEDQMNKQVHHLLDTVPAGMDDPEMRIMALRRALDAAPQAARIHYLLGRALFDQERHTEAAQHFVLARDYDPMPWRATTPIRNALLRAAHERGALLCDLEMAFRAASPGGSIGWELMDDHVHPSRDGQALIARTVIARLTEIDGPLHVTPEAYAALADDKTYAQRLGDNPYDRYGVQHQMRVLFNIPFMRTSNPEAFQRFERECRSFERTLSSDMQEIVRLWQSHRPHAGATRPITGMIARGLMRQHRFDEAIELLAIAQRAVPPYTSWHMEYVYFELACKAILHGGLSEADRARAAEVLAQGRILLAHGYSESGTAERYMGRIHQLRGEYADAIPYLQVARERFTEFDRVAVDQALFLSHIRTGQIEEARALAEFGVQHAGRYAAAYRRMQKQVEATDATGITAP